MGAGWVRGRGDEPAFQESYLECGQLQWEGGSKYTGVSCSRSGLPMGDSTRWGYNAWQQQHGATGFPAYREVGTLPWGPFDHTRSDHPNRHRSAMHHMVRVVLAE